jgi:hypothetical protein
MSAGCDFEIAQLGANPVVIAEKHLAGDGLEMRSPVLLVGQNRNTVPSEGLGLGYMGLFAHSG